jgi:hypothetical protein
MKKLKKIILFSIVFISSFRFNDTATHARAGEIIVQKETMEFLNFWYDATIIAYVKQSNGIEKDSLELFCGNGSSHYFQRVSATLVGPDFEKRNCIKTAGFFLLQQGTRSNISVKNQVDNRNTELNV